MIKILNSIVDSIEVMVISALTMISKLFTDVKTFSIGILIVALTIDLISGGTFGIIKGIALLLEQVKTAITWPLVILIGVIIAGFNKK